MTASFVFCQRVHAGERERIRIGFVNFMFGVKEPATRNRETWIGEPSKVLLVLGAVESRTSAELPITDITVSGVLALEMFLFLHSSATFYFGSDLSPFIVPFFPFTV